VLFVVVHEKYYVSRTEEVEQGKGVEMPGAHMLSQVTHTHLTLTFRVSHTSVDSPLHTTRPHPSAWLSSPTPQTDGAQRWAPASLRPITIHLVAYLHPFCHTPSKDPLSRHKQVANESWHVVIAMSASVTLHRGGG
jgi:hypothetical protein